jgi:tetratricopeptide (TPR) repeat protein
VLDSEALAAQAAQSDRLMASRLAEQLTRGGPLTTDDVRAAENLFARYPAGARELLEAVLLGAAAQAQQRRRPDEAAILLRRATVVAPASPRPWRALLALQMDAGDWMAAESTARSLAAARPDDAEAVRSLAYALLRQDRAREALDALDSFLATHQDPQAAAFRERIRRDQAPEGALDERRLAHFHVRYDGEEHEDVGREVLRLLERHYATLVRTFDYQPASPVPVILLSRQSYYDATGAPAWAGGHYDTFDGRVRIPIAGLTASLASDLEGTLLHELTHAFVADRSQGRAPREIQEGLAQFMEGKRVTTLLDADGLRALADGRIRGVAGFYLSSLALVEDLMAQRGQGGVNDLLAAMADSGADAAFRRVYGKDFAGLRAEAAARLRVRYGS